MKAALRHLRAGADLIGALLFLIMFAAFVVQVFTRYVLNAPVSWTLEACLVAYLWFVFWAVAFQLRDRDHIAFTILVEAVSPGIRRGLAVLATLATVTIFAIALPATVDWVQFMRIERTPDLHIRLDVLFSIFALFMVGVIVRGLFRLRALLTGQEPA